MKTFRYKLSIFLWLILGVVSIILLVGSVFTFIDLFSFNGRAINLIGNIAMLLLDILCLTIVLSDMLISRYEVDEKKGLFLRLGIFRFNLEAEKIEQVIHLVLDKKLVVKYDNDKFTRIVISEENFDKFWEDLRPLNQKMRFIADNEGEKV